MGWKKVGVPPVGKVDDQNLFKNYKDVNATGRELLGSFRSTAILAQPSEKLLLRIDKAVNSRSTAKPRELHPTITFSTVGPSKCVRFVRLIRGGRSTAQRLHYLAGSGRESDHLQCWGGGWVAGAGNSARRSIFFGEKTRPLLHVSSDHEVGS